MAHVSEVEFSARPRYPGDAPVTLRGRLRRPPSATPSPGAAVLCHPHPAFGGTMDVWLLPRIGAALADDGWTVLRFDVRSVRGGAGVTDGTDEVADLAGALDFLDVPDALVSPGAADALIPAGPATAAPVGARRALVGWSFGALLGLLHGPCDERVTDWVGIAPPTRPLAQLPMRGFDPAAVAAWSARRTVIAGRHDQFFPPEDVGAVAPDAVHLLEADHFFFDLDDEVAALAASALRPEVP